MKHLYSGLSFLLLLATTATPVIYGDDGEADGLDSLNNERNIGDLICGPKCVLEILRLYAKEGEDLIRLIQEIQYPDVHKGATLADIAQALEKRGIHTFAMGISPTARIIWQHPVIVHLNPKPGEEIGHFVVWLPESHGDAVQVWNMDARIQQKSERLWSQERSGVILLTAPEPIDDPGKALKWVGLPFCDQMEDIMAWAIFVIGLAFVGKSFRLHRLLRVCP